MTIPAFDVSPLMENNNANASLFFISIVIQITKFKILNRIHIKHHLYISEFF
jgi:hypothetical protein